MICCDKFKFIFEFCCLVVKNGIKIILIIWLLIFVLLLLIFKYSCWLVFCVMFILMYFVDFGLFNCLRILRVFVSRFIIICLICFLFIIISCWFCIDKFNVILSCLVCCECRVIICLVRFVRICGFRCGVGKLLIFLNCVINLFKCLVCDVSVDKVSCKFCLFFWLLKLSLVGSSVV